VLACDVSDSIKLARQLAIVQERWVCRFRSSTMSQTPITIHFINDDVWHHVAIVIVILLT